MPSSDRHEPAEYSQEKRKRARRPPPENYDPRNREINSASAIRRTAKYSQTEYSQENKKRARHSLPENYERDQEINSSIDRGRRAEAPKRARTPEPKSHNLRPRVKKRATLILREDPEPTGSEPTGFPPGLRIATWNTKGFEGSDLTVELIIEALITEHDVSLLCLQESNPSNLRVKKLEDHLKPFICGEYNDDYDFIAWKNSSRPQTSLIIIFSRIKFTVFRLEEYFHFANIKPESKNRPMLMFKGRISNQIYLFGNCHCASGQEAQSVCQAIEFARHLEGIHCDHFYLLGDFNHDLRRTYIKKDLITERLSDNQLKLLTEKVKIIFGEKQILSHPRHMTRQDADQKHEASILDYMIGSHKAKKVIEFCYESLIRVKGDDRGARHCSDHIPVIFELKSRR